MSAVLTQHRAWVRTSFATLLREAGHDDADALGRQLCLLYDGAMVGAQLEGTPQAAVDGRTAAEALLVAE
jgi:hypothetical protein